MTDLVQTKEYSEIPVLGKRKAPEPIAQDATAGLRRSKRQKNEVATYDLEKIFKAEDKEATGSGSISMMLAETIEKVGQDPKGWLMSEKLDGVRCYWNGKRMYTRNGNLFYPPTWFTDALPKDIALDGELWTKRNDFQNVVRIVRKQDANEGWRKITYMVYDAPLLKQNFSKRLETIEEKLKSCDSNIIKMHKQVICKN